VDIVRQEGGILKAAVFAMIHIVAMQGIVISFLRGGSMTSRNVNLSMPDHSINSGRRSEAFTTLMRAR